MCILCYLYTITILRMSLYMVYQRHQTKDLITISITGDS